MPKVVSVFERAKEYETEGFYVIYKEKQVMMCKFCNTVVDWKRKDTCERHYKQRASYAANQIKCQSLPSNLGVKRQVTLENNISLNKRAKETN
ncbi:hypothetical protein PR048_006721 [Dryococelus australis]|uniref:Uncharacterized protein n=1 Tax=Dryococelus australis TaxID=614101 RepID=A0ABQ9ICR6_9NEOP|nr:hypothetical protein PR048_006721 [Dryococelus australis]